MYYVPLYCSPPKSWSQNKYAYWMFITPPDCTDCPEHLTNKVLVSANPCVNLDFWECSILNKVVLLLPKELWAPQSIMPELGCMVMIKYGTSWISHCVSQVCHDLIKFPDE